MSRLRFLLRQHAYDADGNLLVRPALITGALALTAVLLPLAEERSAALRVVGDNLRWAVPAEPAAVQLVLGTIAGSVMTVVSIVYSVLVVALTLTSVQFSPRILATFIRDRVSQKVIGIFIGTFTYCLLVLRATRSAPEPFVPTLSAFLAIVLVITCLGSLLYFIHHMAKSIQANHIVDRIAHETEQVIDSVLPPRAASPEPPAPAPAERARAVRAPSSGYVQLLAADDLAELAKQEGTTIHVIRGMGQFVPEGGVLALVDREDLSEEACRDCAAAFDLGPHRTMQDDLELGFRLIVDIALKAISPAVNDPSTAATCIDHLARLLGRVARRGAPRRVILGGDEQGGRALVVVPPAGFDHTIDLAFHQIRQYGKGDMAVLLRMVRALDDLASMTDDAAHRAAIARHAALVREAGAPFGPHDRAELDRRQAKLLAALTAAPD